MLSNPIGFKREKENANEEKEKIIK